MGAARRRGTFEERRARAVAAWHARAEARRAAEEAGRARRQSTPAPTECAPGRAYPLATALLMAGAWVIRPRGIA